MVHARQDIRDYAKTLLTSLTTTGSNVFASRTYALPETDLPGLLIYTSNEKSRKSSMRRADGTEVYERDLTLIIVGVVKNTTDANDTCDDIADEVETQLKTDPTFSNTIHNLFLESTDTAFVSEIDKPVWTITLTYQLSYLY